MQEIKKIENFFSDFNPRGLSKDEIYKIIDEHCKTISHLHAAYRGFYHCGNSPLKGNKKFIRTNLCITLNHINLHDAIINA